MGTRSACRSCGWIAAALLVACSRSGGPPAPGGDASAAPRGFDPLAAAAEGRTDGVRRPLSSGAGLDPADWRLAAELGAPGDAPVDGAAVAADGVLELRGPHLAAVRFLPLDAGTRWLEVGVALQSVGRRGGDAEGYARFGVLQVELDALPDDLAQVPARILDQHFCEPRSEPDPTPVPVEFAFARAPAARGLVLVLENIDPAGVGAAARFSDLRVDGVDASAAARALAEEYAEPTPAGGWPADRPRYGRFEADLVHRHGVALPAGGRATLPVARAVAGWRFEAFACVLGPDHAGQWTVSVEWSDGAGRTRPIAARTLPTEPDGDADTAPAGWAPLVGAVPSDAESEGALVLRVAGPDGAPPASGAVLAGARLTPPGPAPERPNLLFVSLDTVRADHLGAYGDPRPITPHLDALAREARRFTDVWTNAPYTLPAHVSMLSGQLPTVHGVQRPSQRRDRVRTPLLAELLADAGYRTAAFTGGAMVLPRFGFAAGFERYGVLDPWINLESERTRRLLDGLHGIGPRAFARTGLGALEAELERFGDEPWFLFVHTYAAHEFDPPREHLAALGALEGRPADDPEILRYLANRQPPPPELRRRLEELYAGGVRHADALVGALVALLEERGELDSTLVVVTSDHGKEIGEHGMVGHGHVLYGELVRVPLLLRGPGVPPGSDARPAQSVDLVPTLLARLGLPAPSGLQGRDLLAPGPFEVDRALWAEVDAGERLQALRSGPRKTIRDLGTGAVQQFQLDRDPGERAPSPASEAALVALEDFAAALQELHRALPAEGRSAATLDAAARAHLEALGYVLDDGLLRGSRTEPPERR